MATLLDSKVQALVEALTAFSPPASGGFDPLRCRGFQV